MPLTKSPDLIGFLQNDLSLSDAAIQLGMRQANNNLTLLPIALWHYGLVDLVELNQIFDWLERCPVTATQL